MLRGIFAIAVMLGVMAQAPVAIASDGQFAVEEYGRVGCAEFTAARTNKDGAAYARIMGFVQGYLTAANRYEVDTFDLSPWHNAPAFDLILDKHCQDKPKDTLVATLQMMVSAFRPLRVAKPSPIVKVSDGQKYLFVYDAILRRAEMVLKARGYLAATTIPAAATTPQPYAYTPVLREAFRKYQTDKGLDPTGLPDTATLWTLLNP